MLSGQTPERVWNTRRTEKQRRLASVPVQGKVLPTDDLVAMLEKLIAPGDKVVLEGNNQKQADFLSRALASDAVNISTFSKKASPTSWTFLSRVPKACVSHSCWKMACWKSALFIPTSSCIPACMLTSRQTWH